MRIVSLLPSATEILCAIEGGEPMLVGRSHECDFPPSVQHLPALTAQRVDSSLSSAEIDRQVRRALDNHRSLYTIDEQRLRELQPDVILTQDLCSVCSIDLNAVRAIAGGMSPSPRILSLNPRTIEDVFDDILHVGEAAGLRSEAQRAMVQLRGCYWEARDFVNPYHEGSKVAFLEWIDPIFIGGHWTPQLIHEAGGRHTLNAPGQPSRRIEARELIAWGPDVIIICPCGRSLERTRREAAALRTTLWWNDLPATRAGRVYLVDGSAMFNRPGPRLVDAFCWLVGILNDRPEVIPTGFPAERADGAAMADGLPAHVTE